MTHRYPVTVEWTGNRGTGTHGYAAYGREHTIRIKGKADIECSSDPSFWGNAALHNPEDLLTASLSACHMLWYLSLCASAGVVVTAYTDDAEGSMEVDKTGGGRFTRVVLKPKVTLAPDADRARAEALHAEAHEKCFIANSVNFPVVCEPTFD